MTKFLRQKRCISQELLAEQTGLSLRTIQRVESGQRISNSSLRSLASFFDVSVEHLKQEGQRMAESANTESEKVSAYLSYHRAAQLIIFVVAFFVCISQWLGYYAVMNPDPSDASDASLGTILMYVSLIALAATPIAYLFSLAKVTFYRGYYTTLGAFFMFLIAMDYWTQPFSGSASYLLLFPVLYTLLLLTLSLFHVLQLALSLKSESVVFVPK